MSKKKYITGMMAWGNGEPCPICKKHFDRPSMEHLFSHPEAMEILFPKGGRK